MINTFIYFDINEVCLLFTLKGNFPIVSPGIEQFYQVDMCWLLTNKMLLNVAALAE